jgi:hypothetical protein
VGEDGRGAEGDGLPCWAPEPRVGAGGWTLEAGGVPRPTCPGAGAGAGALLAPTVGACVLGTVVTDDGWAGDDTGR